MDRNEAKRLLKNLEYVEAFAAGAEIEYRSTNFTGDWSSCKKPGFIAPNMEYRAKQQGSNTMTLKDKELEKKLRKTMSKLERQIDYIGPTPLRQYLDQMLVDMRKEFNKFSEDEYDRNMTVVSLPFVIK